MNYDGKIKELIDTMIRLMRGLWCESCKREEPVRDLRGFLYERCKGEKSARELYIEAKNELYNELGIQGDNNPSNESYDNVFKRIIKQYIILDKDNLLDKFRSLVTYDEIKKSYEKLNFFMTAEERRQTFYEIQEKQVLDSLLDFVLDENERKDVKCETTLNYDERMKLFLMLSSLITYNEVTLLNEEVKYLMSKWERQDIADKRWRANYHSGNIIDELNKNANVESYLMPKEMMPNRETFEQLGFKFTDIREDAISYKTILPEGWIREYWPNEKEGPYFNIIDQNGFIRAEGFKADFSEGDFYQPACMRLKSRYGIHRNYLNDSYNSVEIYFGDEYNKIFVSGRISYNKFDSEESLTYYKTREESLRCYAECFADKHYPDWRNPTSYWDYKNPLTVEEQNGHTKILMHFLHHY